MNKKIAWIVGKRNKTKTLFCPWYSFTTRTAARQFVGKANNNLPNEYNAATIKSNKFYIEKYIPS